MQQQFWRVDSYFWLYFWLYTLVVFLVVFLYVFFLSVQIFGRMKAFGWN